MADQTQSIQLTVKTRNTIDEGRVFVEELALIEQYLPDLIKQVVTQTEGKEE